MKNKIKVLEEIVVIVLVIAVLAVMDWCTRWIPSDKPGYYEE